jgi:catechol 2,3-dioxygenase-like lactoylglutathione lyase family enzyme
MPEATLPLRGIGRKKLFSHIMIGVSDFDRAMAFYQPIMEALGVKFRFVEEARPWAGWQSTPEPRPLFLIGRPFNKQNHEPGNGQMVAFLAASREVVNRVHAMALKSGGTCDGPPGLRPEYHEHYYGAYFKDPDDNKLCVACHRAE